MISFKKLLLLGFILVASPAEARDWYFSFSTGGNITAASSNSNACTLASPCVDFWGKGLSAQNALAAGDNVYYDAGDTWPEASNQSRIEVFSSGTASSRIKFLPYGSGSPTLKGTTDVTGWTLCSSGCPANTYQKTGVTTDPFRLYTVTQGTDKALGRYAFRSNGGSLLDGQPGSNTTLTQASLPEGHFFFDAQADIMYVRLWGQVDPSTTTVGLPQLRATGPAGDGGQGLFAISPLNANFGKYITIEGFTITGANGMGLTFSGQGFGYVKNTTVIGAGRDGVDVYHGQGNGFATDVIFDGVTVTYSAASGSGAGQGFTTYALRTLWYNCVAHHNFMAGFDFLSGFDASSDASFSACKNCTAYDNGLWGSPRGFDPNYYIDGPTNIVIKDSVCYHAGVNPVTTAAGVQQINNRHCIKIGSEHPSTDAVTDIHIINNLIHTSINDPIRTANIPNTVDNITRVNIINNTVIAYRGSSGSFRRIYNLADTASTADGIVMRNNIFYARGSYYVDDFATTDARIDADYNLYWTQGGTTSSNIYHTNVNGGGSALTFSAWKTATGEDANSVMADPQFITDTEGSYNARLKQTAAGQATTSSAVNAGMENAWTCPSWVYSQWPTYFPECASGQQPIQGSTRSDGVADDVATNIDIGYHYAAVDSGSPITQGSLTSVSFSHSSSLTATNGTETISFTLGDNAWPSDGKLLALFDTDFTFNSGGTTTASCTSGCDGSLAFSSAAGLVTLTRSGGTSTSASTACTVTLSNVRTPNTAQTVDSHTLQTTTSASDTLDSITGVSGATFSDPPATPATGSARVVTGSFKASGTFKVELK